jgi:hypothetical protein
MPVATYHPRPRLKNALRWALVAIAGFAAMVVMWPEMPRG